MKSLVNVVVANSKGQIRDLPNLLMLCRRNNSWALPLESELIPLPNESELFLLPGRQAVGFNPRSRKIELINGSAVAAFIAPGYTISAHPAWQKEDYAPLLPLFAYAAVGFRRGKLYVCAKQMDREPRQKFAQISRQKLAKAARQVLRDLPGNRLAWHIINDCLSRYDCPAARNFALGRYEAPLPTSTACNAKCRGCISHQEATSLIKITPQIRLTFVPTATEIAEIMLYHQKRELKQPIYSFGQGCEGDPLLQWQLLVESIRFFRKKGGKGTVNCNTNGSIPEAIPELADAGLTSLRISLNSARPELYNAYFRPQSYTFDNVRQTLINARKKNLFVSLNLLFFPNVTDTETELKALSDLISQTGVSMIQWRNLNIDPDWYTEILTEEIKKEPGLGLEKFLERLQALCPWLRHGYFNPWLGDQATLTAPLAIS